MNPLLARQSPGASCWSRAAPMWPPLPIRAARSGDSAILNWMACPVCRYRTAEAELSGFTKAENACAPQQARSGRPCPPCQCGAGESSCCWPKDTSSAARHDLVQDREMRERPDRGMAGAVGNGWPDPDRVWCSGLVTGRVMSGCELAQQFYAEVVAPLLARAMPRLRYAAGRLGSGSDVLGLDDAMSRDHDWGCRLTLLVDGPNREAVPQIDGLL